MHEIYSILVETARKIA